MYVLVVWGMLNGTMHGHSALYHLKEKCEEDRVAAIKKLKEHPEVQNPQGVCINVLAKYI